MTVKAARPDIDPATEPVYMRVRNMTRNGNWMISDKHPTAAALIRQYLQDSSGHQVGDTLLWQTYQLGRKSGRPVERILKQKQFTVSTAMAEMQHKSAAQRAVVVAAAKNGLKADSPDVIAADIMSLRAEYLALEDRMSQLYKRCKYAGMPEAQEGMGRAMNIGLQIVPTLYQASQSLIGKRRTSKLR